jgi:bacterioferritin-associated ferredoxin
MIVCSCNVLSAKAIKGCMAPGPECPRTPAQVYCRLGCRAECGRCASTIRRLMDNALSETAPTLAAGGACQLGCCPKGQAHPASNDAGTGAATAA